MANSIPSIACIGIISRNNNPLHIQIFPTHEPNGKPLRTPLQFSLLLSSTIDVFAMRAAAAAATPGQGLTGDLGLLHAVDDRLAAYGFETNTGVRFVVVVDVRGRRVGGEGRKVGLREGELKPAFKALQSAYVSLLQNPFYDPDDHVPPSGRGGKKITTRKFTDEVRRIGETWMPGMASV